MRRYSWLLLVLLLCPSLAAAQGTLIPFVPQAFYTATGVPCSGCKLYAYAAGTTTAQATYYDQDLDITHVNANPVVMTSGGRPTTGYIYLSATSYKFILKTSADVTIWTVDEVSAIPTTTAFLDVEGIAGEALAAGDVAYLSDGSGALTAGRWYKADSDNTYSSTTATQVGMVPTAIASAATGSIRLGGRVSNLSALSAGEDYYVSATAGGLTATPPANARYVGRADTTTSLDMSGGAGALRLPDSDGTHSLVVKTTSNLTADRLFTLVPGDAARTLTVSGDSTVNQDLSTTGSPTFTAATAGTVTASTSLVGSTSTTTPLIIGNTTTNLLRTSTSDAADSASWHITGGGASGNTRGALLRVTGNEDGTYPGSVVAATGNVANSNFRVIRSDGNIAFQVAGADGFLTSIYTYSNTTGSAASMYIDSNGLMFRSTSSARYKKNIQPMRDWRWLLNLTPELSERVDDKPGRQFVSFLAEDVARLGPADSLGNPIFAGLDKQGRPDDVAYAHFVVPLTAAVQEYEIRITELEKRLAAAEAAIAELTKGP